MCNICNVPLAIKYLHIYLYQIRKLCAVLIHKMLPFFPSLFSFNFDQIKSEHFVTQQLECLDLSSSAKNIHNFILLFIVTCLFFSTFNVKRA